MARLVSAAELQRRTNIRVAREAEIARRRSEGRPAGTVVNRRGPSTQLFYRSLFRKLSATEHAAYSIRVPDDTLAAVGGNTAVGLLATLPATEQSMGSVRREILPTRAFFYRGDVTPTVQRSDWGSNWTRNYAVGSHQSVPLSVATGTYDAADIRTLFGALFGPGGTAAAQLGDSNGRAYLRMETEKEKPTYSS